MRRSTTLAIAATVAVGVTAGVCLAARAEFRDRDTRRSNPSPGVAFVLTRASVRSGLAIEDDQIVITSYDEWVRFAPDAIEDAVVDGVIGAEGVLTELMRQALPRYRWPPDPGSKLAEQWPKMVQIVAEKLRLDTDPEPNTSSRRLRLL